MDKLILNARGSEICDKFWKGMGICCHIFFFILAWYTLANVDDVLKADEFDDEFGNFSLVEQQKHGELVFSCMQKEKSNIQNRVQGVFGKLVGI